MMKQSSENHLHTWWRTLRGKEFLQNAIVHWLIIAIFFLVLVHSAVIVYFLRPTDSALILHYNVYFGVDLIGAWWHVYALPLGGFLLFLLNTILAYWFFCLLSFGFARFKTCPVHHSCPLLSRFFDLHLAM